jgi:hypothetical protein
LERARSQAAIDQADYTPGYIPYSDADPAPSMNSKMHAADLMDDDFEAVFVNATSSATSVGASDETSGGVVEEMGSAAAAKAAESGHPIENTEYDQAELAHMMEETDTVDSPLAQGVLEPAASEGSSQLRSAAEVEEYAFTSLV